MTGETELLTWLSQYIREGGILALFLLFIAMLARGVVVWGWQYRLEQREKEWWKRQALRGVGLAEEAMGENQK